METKEKLWASLDEVVGDLTEMGDILYTDYQASIQAAEQSDGAKLPTALYDVWERCSAITRRLALLCAEARAAEGGA